MLTSASIALAALLWLLRLTLGDDPEAGGWLRPDRIVHAALGLSVLAAVLVLQRLLRQVLRGWGGAEKRATSDLLQAVISIVLYLVAAMLYLSVGLGLDITSVLATSAVLSVIVGLALQPTLGNLFAGVSIEIERPLRAGDFVRRDGIDGQVLSLNWRSVRLLTTRDSRLVLPNNEFNGRPLEVIPADQPYQHRVDFQLGSELPPAQVQQLAMQVLCSGLPGICETPPPSVVVLGNDAATGCLRYAARFHTFRFMDCTTIASGFLERFWYALSRERLAFPAWNHALEARAPADDGPRHGSEAASGGGDRRWRQGPGIRGAADDRPPPVSGWPVPDGAAAGPGAEPDGIARLLLPCAAVLRYGPGERCDSDAVAVVLRGSLVEERPMAAAQAEACFEALMRALAQEDDPAGPQRLDGAVHRSLLHEGALALGPLAHGLCRRIAMRTADPHLAYRAFAASIPQPAQRAEFLARAPRQESRSAGAGEWLGWARALGLEPQARACRASPECTLLAWSPRALRAALRPAAAEEQEALAERLRTTVPGCEALTPARWRAWMAQD